MKSIIDADFFRMSQGGYPLRKAGHAGICLLLNLLLVGGLLCLEGAQAAAKEFSIPLRGARQQMVQPEEAQQAQSELPIQRQEVGAANQANPFDDGVQAYRKGNYKQAHSMFSKLHQQRPEDSRVTYYLAITEAQLGRFAQAKALYEEILALDPNGDAAALAKIGLTYLPAEHRLDLPPRFQYPDEMAPTATAPGGNLPQHLGNPGYGAGMGQNANSLPAGMSPQDMMALQALMGTGGGGNNALANPMGNPMMNPMANPMMLMMQNGGAGGAGYDPNAMSNMIMNQMLQNFTLDGGSNENR